MPVLRWLFIVATVVLAAAGAAGAQSRPPNELPMFGGIAKSEAMLAADKAFIDAVVATGRTRQSGAAQAADRGFEALSRGDHALAMRRFNQAWLLDPDNPEAYHGFALVLLDRDRDPVRGEAMFRKALSYAAVNPGAFADYGLFLVRVNRIAEALEVLEHGLQKAPDMASLRSHHAVAVFLSGDVDRGCRAVQAEMPRAAPEERPLMSMILGSEECRALVARGRD